MCNNKTTIILKLIDSDTEMDMNATTSKQEFWQWPHIYLKITIQAACKIYWSKVSHTRRQKAINSYNYPMCSSVITACYSPEPLLSSSIPLKVQEMKR